MVSQSRRWVVRKCLGHLRRDELCATADLGLVFLFFVRGSYEEI